MVIVKLETDPGRGRGRGPEIERVMPGRGMREVEVQDETKIERSERRARKKHRNPRKGKRSSPSIFQQLL
jgi:hypothetical protein